MRFTVDVDGKPFDVLHNKVRQAGSGRAAVKQPRDVRMVEISQNLTLVTEVAQHCVGIHSTFDQLDSNLLPVLLIRPFSQINSTHAAATDFTHDSIRSNQLTARN